jgi:hypothetical protein
LSHSRTKNTPQPTPPPLKPLAARALQQQSSITNRIDSAQNLAQASIFRAVRGGSVAAATNTIGDITAATPVRSIPQYYFNTGDASAYWEGDVQDSASDAEPGADKAP